MNAEQMESQGIDRTFKRLIVKTGDRRSIVNVKDIDYIEASGNYVDVHVSGRRHLIRETMRNLELRLPRALFIRISRSTFVNLHRITELQRVDPDKYRVHLTCGDRLAMTRNLGEVQEALKYS